MNAVYIIENPACSTLFVRVKVLRAEATRLTAKEPFEAVVQVILPRHADGESEISHDWRFPELTLAGSPLQAGWGFTHRNYKDRYTTVYLAGVSYEAIMNHIIASLKTELELIFEAQTALVNLRKSEKTPESVFEEVLNKLPFPVKLQEQEEEES